MRLHTLALLASLAPFVHAQTHGEGEEGSSMGPVAFLWPPDRIWDAQHDNTAPCGSAVGPSNRTIFPLSQGSVSLTIADDAYKIAFRLAIGDNPTSQDDFDDQIVSNVSEIEPGHQCYKIDRLEGIPAGTNATIQLEYWAEFEGENDGKNQSFFACADITFVETINFDLQASCFNVTSDGFNAPTPSGSSSLPSATSGSGSSNQSPSEQTSSGGGGGLSTGAKAGIAVGAIIGGLALISAIGFFLWRRGKAVGLRGKQNYELRAKDLSTASGAASTEERTNP